MKKLLILGAVTALAIVALTGAGYAYAHENDLGLNDLLSGNTASPVEAPAFYQYGDGDLHEYIHAALAEALGLSVEELDTRLAGGARLSDLIEEQGLTEEEFQAAYQAALEVQLAAAVADGVITQEQADVMAANGMPFMHQHGPGGWMGSGPDQGWMGGPGFGMFGPQSGLLESFLGLTAEEIDARIENGESLEDILTAEGKTVEELAAYVKDQRIAAVNEALANGEITQEQADEILARIESMDADCFGIGGFGSGMMGGGMMGGGPMGGGFGGGMIGDGPMGGGFGGGMMGDGPMSGGQHGHHNIP